MASISMIGKGTKVEVSKTLYDDLPDDLDTITDFVDLSCIATAIQCSGISADERDVSALCSPAKEFEAGDIDPGTITFNAHLVPNQSEVYQTIYDATLDRKKRAWKVTHANGSVFCTIGYIQSRPWEVPGMAELVSQTIEVRCSGLPREILVSV